MPSAYARFSTGVSVTAWQIQAATGSDLTAAGGLILQTNIKTSPSVTLDRRELIGTLGALAATRLLGDDGAPAAMPQPGAAFPRKADFAIPAGTTYLNAAYTHPIPRVSAVAARTAAERRSAALPAPSGVESPKSLFARLINAKPAEIAHVSSTSAG
jgi:hypothetical protein